MIDARELIDRHAVAFAACDWDAVKEFWHPEAELISPGGRWPVSEMERIMAGLSRDYEDIVIDVTDAFYSPDKTRLALEWTYASTRLSDGERTSSPDAIMVDLRDGLIIRWREYFDSATSV
jgi:ketosteroid isomerase-like protein